MNYTICLPGLMIVLWVTANGSITLRYILLWHQINGGLWRTLYWATFIIIGAHRVLDLGTITSTYWGACTMVAPRHTCCLWWQWQLLIQYDSFGITLLPTSTCVVGIWHHLGWISHITLECSHLMWISLWLVAIGLTSGAFCSHTGCWVGSGW